MDIIEQYKELHRQGWFPGGAIKSHIPEIAGLILQHGAETLLDYGCGKAQYYFREKWHENLGLSEVYLYDPAAKVDGVKNQKPDKKFDAVICTDVLEHVENPKEVISELIGYANKFLFCSISCKPSKAHKKLLDGRPVHITIHPPEWWDEILYSYDFPVYARYDV